MSLLPTENHNLIIQTCVEKEPEPCEIKINDKRKKKKYAGTIWYIFSNEKKATYSKKINARQGHEIYSVVR